MENRMKNIQIIGFDGDFDLERVKAYGVDFSSSDVYCITPGFCDVHVHFREPGFSYKETIKTGSMAASHGGYTAVCTMPNLNPVPDSVENIKRQLEIIEKDSEISVIPYASITVGQNGTELTDFEALSPYCIAFSDDGKGVQSAKLMEEAMQRAKAHNKMIVAHCEDNSLLFGGYIHDGEYARAKGHRGICSESEWGQIARDVALAEKTGCKYHVCHISCKESVDIIRKAKARGVDVSCETAPHYLTLTDDNLHEDGSFKMNPPIRGKADRDALIEGLIDGTVDIIATDHAPHSMEEKSKGLEKSPFGIVGLETAFSVLYTDLVKTGKVTLETVINALTVNPRNRFNIENGEDFTVWNLSKEYTVNPEKFLSKGHSTPFEGKNVYAECILTVHNGKAVYKK